MDYRKIRGKEIKSVFMVYCFIIKRKKVQKLEYGHHE